MTTVAIRTASLCKTYGYTRAVVDFTLSVPPAQVLVLLGPNAAGKTTLLKMIAGLLVPDRGRVYLNGHDLLHERDSALQQVVAVVQGIRQLDEERSVGQNLSFPDLGGAECLLRDLDLWPVRDSCVSHLPHSFRQRVRVAQALGAGSPILLLDEPTLGLDARAARAVKGWIRKLASEQGKTIVVATCCRELAQELGDRVVVIESGCPVADVPLSKAAGLSKPAIYQIRVKGVLDAHWTTWFDGLTVMALYDETLVSGLFVDQPALHSLLIRIRDLGLPLLSVNRIEPGLEALKI